MLKPKYDFISVTDEIQFHNKDGNIFLNTRDVKKYEFMYMAACMRIFIFHLKNTSNGVSMTGINT